MLEQVQAYKTKDGKIFTDSEEARLHGMDLHADALINNFLQQQEEEYTDRRKATASRIIREFLKTLDELPNIPKQEGTNDEETA